MKTNQTPKKSIKAMPIEKKKWVKPKMKKLDLNSGSMWNPSEDMYNSPNAS